MAVLSLSSSVSLVSSSVSPAGSKPALPQVAAPSLPKVHPARVASVGFADRPTQAGLRLRDHDQVHVVGHQAVRSHLDAARCTPLGHQFDVGVIVAIAKERPLPAVPSLRDMMRKTGGNDTCYSRHASIVRASVQKGNGTRYGVPDSG